MKTPLKCWVDAAVGWGVFPLGGQHVGNGTDFTAKAHKQGKKKSTSSHGLFSTHTANTGEANICCI